LNIGSDETEKPNEIEDKPEIEKEKNHEVEFNGQEKKIEEEIISLKIQLEEEKRMEEVMKNLLALRVTLRLLEDKPSAHQNVKDKFWFEKVDQQDGERKGEDNKLQINRLHQWAMES
jgi:hypothetical protein